MIKALVFIGLLILPVELPAQAPTNSDRRVDQNAVGSVVNEDRGYAYIITAETRPCFPNSRRSGELPIQYSIFLGDGWNSDALRFMEPSLANLSPSSQPSGANPFHESPSGTLRGAISDLAVQQRIREVMENNSAPRVTPSMLVVVYLDPTFHSRLAELEGGKHYLAYSNAFNIEGSRIRYIVVPAEASLKGLADTARKAFQCSVFGS